MGELTPQPTVIDNTASPSVTLDQGLTMVFRRLLILEEKFNKINLIPGPKGENGQDGKKGDRGEIGKNGIQGLSGPIGKNGQVGNNGNKGINGNKGDTGEKGEIGESGKDGITTIKHIYEPLPKEIEDKLGSLGTVGGDSDLEKKAKDIMDKMSRMADEIHDFKEGQDKLKIKQARPFWKKILRRD